MSSFNPLDIQNLAHSMVTRMEETAGVGLDDVPKFEGAGIYALYYTGTFPAYRRIAQANAEELRDPIYIGKAVPSGGRRGVTVSAGPTYALNKRLADHAKSVLAAENLDVDDFKVRWLVVEDIWIPLGESAMLRRYQPVWNALVDGFGNHHPGKGRINGIRSLWDTVHPGRSWAPQFPPRPDSAAEIEQKIEKYLESRDIPQWRTWKFYD